MTVKPCDSQTYWGTPVSLPSHQASLRSKQISHKIVNGFFLLWILANIPFLVHEMCTIRITKMFPQILSKPASVNGIIPVWGWIRGMDQPVSIYQGSLCVANFIPGLKWELKAKVMVSHFYIYLCPSVLLGMTVCSQLSWSNLFPKTTQSRTEHKLHRSSRWSPKHLSSPMKGLFSIHRDRLDQNSSD